MSDKNQELERLKRLREQQLSDRDPLVKQRQFQRVTTQRERRAKKPYTLGRMWKDIPRVWKGFFYGIVLGTLIMLVVPMLWISSWAVPCSAINLVIFAIFGASVGRAIDTRENIKDLMR